MNDLSKRLFDFIIKTINFLKTLPKSSIDNVIISQLTKSSASTEANYEEAQAGSSRRDFNNKVSIALKEMRETNYWLRIIKHSKISNKIQELDFLINESNELKNILGSIVSKTRKNQDKKLS